MMEKTPMDGSTYLGDGLYVRDDGYMFTLLTMRGANLNTVCIEPQTMDNFFRFLERARRIKIRIDSLATPRES